MADLPDGTVEAGQSLTPAMWLKGPWRSRRLFGGNSVDKRYHRHAVLYRRGEGEI